MVTFSHKYIKKTHIYIQNDSHGTSIECWQNSNIQKRARNPPQKQVAKRKKREREKRKQDGTSTSKMELLKRKGTHTLGCHHINGEISQDGRDLKVAKKSATAGLRRTKQSESHTDHQHHCPRNHCLKCQGRVWALKLRFWRSVLGRGLGLAGDHLRGQGAVC